MSGTLRWSWRSLGDRRVSAARWKDLPAVRLDGLVALVTGAGRGIGRAIALALGDAGAAVAVCARSEDEVTDVAGEIEGRGGHALAIRCDVTDRQQVESMVAAAEDAIGPVDLLVNNVGRFGPVGPLAATDPDNWWQTLEVNLRGPLYCTRAVLPGMLTRCHGRIVNVSSGVGFAAIPMLSAYVVSKTALYRLSENLAAETRGHGVTVLAIDPGLVRTAISESAFPRRAQHRTMVHRRLPPPGGRLRGLGGNLGGLPRVGSGRRPFRPQHPRNRGPATDGSPGG